jgi:DNA-binding LacI/PurR family transcriptional regulator
MSEFKHSSKNQIVADHFREMILSGTLEPDAKIIPDSEIARHFKVNKRTVAKGMTQLVAEGLISRSPGRGSLVLRRKAVERDSRAVGIISFNAGHLHSDVAVTLTDGILKHDLYPVWISQAIFRKAVYTPNHPPLTKMLETLIDDCPYGMIIDGERFLPFELLRRNQARLQNMVFILHYMYKERLPAKYVLVDYREGARRVAACLYAKGHRKITFLARGQQFLNHYEPTAQMLLIEGLEEAFRAHGGEFNSEIPRRMVAGEDRERVFMEEFPGSGITAAMVPYDAFWVNNMAPIAARMGLRVPEDFSVIGCYNTPWAEEYSPRLTSLHIRQSRVARLAVQMLFGEIPDTEISIVPEIAERDSVYDYNL